MGLQRLSCLIRQAQIIALKQKENPVLREFALSASVLALAGSLAVAQAETMTNSIERPLGGRAIVAFDGALASLRYL
jgi:hypothetical protein